MSSTPETDFSDVTEMAGEDISSEQLFRMCNRYFWAAGYCEGRDVLEAACGTGPGLGYLAKYAKSVAAGDFSPTMVRAVSDHYGERIPVQQFDAQQMPFEDASLDVVILFEALYYIPDASAFVAECARVLRPSGKVLISNANCDLYDFNPSPYSSKYHGVVEMKLLFASAGFVSEFFGSTPIASVGLKQKILRPIKKIVVSFGLMPKSMAGKRLLKRLVFGQSVPMPAEITVDMAETEAPTPISSDTPNKDYKVLYCAATKTQ